MPDAKHELEQTFRKLGVGVDDPRDIGTIKDPTSDARLQLIVNTQENLAYGYGRYIATQDPTRSTCGLLGTGAGVARECTPRIQGRSAAGRSFRCRAIHGRNAGPRSAANGTTAGV